MIHGVPNDTVVATWHKPLDLVFFLSIMKIRIKNSQNIRWNSYSLVCMEFFCSPTIWRSMHYWSISCRQLKGCDSESRSLHTYVFWFQSLQNCTLDAFLHCLLGTLPIMVFIEHILDISKVLTLKFLVQKRSLKWKNVEFIFSLKHYFLYELNWFIVHSQICFVVIAASQSSHF